MKHIIYSALFLLLITITSCSKDDDLNQSEQLVLDVEKIENYLKEHNLSAEKTTSGLYYIITEEGTGKRPNSNSTVKVNYTGRLLDGTQFDSNTATFPLANVIQGWQEGIPLFKAGGKGKLFIPSYIGYGVTGSSSIPPNSVLMFDIHLISVN